MILLMLYKEAEKEPWLIWHVLREIDVSFILPTWQSDMFSFKILMADQLNILIWSITFGC